MEAYCAIDVFLLAEVFTQFRIQALKDFGIDPNNYISLPGMALDCFLKKTQVELDPIPGNTHILKRSKIRKI